MSRRNPTYGLLITAAVIPVILVSAPLCGALAQGPALLTPTAPPPGPLAFDVPLSGCLVEEAASHRLTFVDAVATEAGRFAEGPAKACLDRMLSVAEQLSSTGGGFDATMQQLAIDDPSFGIPDLSQLPPSENAFRDTLWGSVVWHESASGKTRETTAFLKFLVGRLADIGSEANSVASELRDAEWAALDEISNRRYGEAGSIDVPVWEKTRRLEWLAAEADTTSRALAGLVAGIQAGGIGDSAPAEAAWAQMIEESSTMVRHAELVGPCVADVRVNHAIMQALVGVIRATEQSAEELLSSPERRGRRFIPWENLRESIGAVGELRAKVLEGGAAHLPEGSDEALWFAVGSLTTSNRILTERAVERSSTEVAWIGDLLMNHYLAEAGYDGAADEKRRKEARDSARQAMDGNIDYQSALMSAAAARASFAEGIAGSNAGGEGYSRALIQFKNAWLHSLNAGAAADRALKTAGM